MKPILEWYEQLPEPIRSQAIANYDPSFSETTEAPSLHIALQLGFIWDESPEGFQCWSDVYAKADNCEYNNPTLAQTLTQLEATLNEVKQALEEVRKAIRNESN